MFARSLALHIGRKLCMPLATLALSQPADSSWSEFHLGCFAKTGVPGSTLVTFNFSIMQCAEGHALDLDQVVNRTAFYRCHDTVAV